MATLLILRASLLLGLLLIVEAHAAQAVPAVYRDEYVAIHAGVAEIGLRPIHLGDAISFVVQLEFNADQVRVESLNSDFLQRAFADKENISLYAPPDLTQEVRADGDIAIQASWPFQILGCPEGLPHCRGDKNYELPVIAVSYQIIDETGEVVNDKSARFRSGPVAVASAVADPHGTAGKFADYFPGGAHPEVLPVEAKRTAGMVAMFAGILLLVVGFNNRSSQQTVQQQATHSHPPANRWERALARLQDDPMPDDQWADLLRRCASWYCLDELGRNPHARLATDFDRFFADVLEQESIVAERRDDYLDRFLSLAGEET